MPSNRKNILVVCSRNKRRSLTAEQLYRHHPQLSVRSAGTSPSARHQVSSKDIEWAYEILCMEQKHKEYIERTFASQKLPQMTVVNIPDQYAYMEPELCELLKMEIEGVIECSVNNSR